MVDGSTRTKGPTYRWPLSTLIYNNQQPRRYNIRRKNAIHLSSRNIHVAHTQAIIKVQNPQETSHVQNPAHLHSDLHHRISNPDTLRNSAYSLHSPERGKIPNASAELCPSIRAKTNSPKSCGVRLHKPTVGTLLVPSLHAYGTIGPVQDRRGRCRASTSPAVLSDRQ